MTLKTEFWAKPIPTTEFDWEAWNADSYEPGHPIGYGSTEAEAIQDFLEQIASRE